MASEISKQVEQLMENLICTVELAEEAPDFVANAVQDLFDEYADAKLETAASALESIDGGAVAAQIRGMKKNSVKLHIAEELGKLFSDRSNRT